MGAAHLPTTSQLHSKRHSLDCNRISNIGKHQLCVWCFAQKQSFEKGGGEEKKGLYAQGAVFGFVIGNGGGGGAGD